MKNVKDYFKVIAFVLAIGMAISLGGSFFQTFLAGLRYATMSEKDASKEVVVHTENDFFKFDISEYNELEKMINTILYPCYVELLPVLDQINFSIKNEQSTLEQSIHDFYLVIEKWQTIFLSESINHNGQIKILLSDINNDFLDIKNAINRVLSNRAESAIQIANENFLVSRIKDFHFNYSYLLLDLFYGIRDNVNLSILFNYVVDSINNLDNDPLIDLETPYFSLPMEYAENKEKQIFSHIDKGRRDPRSIMALILLYIKMKNITDAELLYSKIIAPLHLVNSQDIELSRTIALMLSELRNNNPNAILDKTIIEVDANMNVNITEQYFIYRPENDKDVYVFLPYDINNIALLSLTDNRLNNLQIKNIEPSWKNSCYLQFGCAEDLVEFTLNYRVKNFFTYSENYGTYSYRYGGISQSVNYTCEIIMPNFLKTTTFLQYPTAIKKSEENEQNILWTNPQIPFKISPLNFSDYKNGIAGEIVPMRLLYNKWVYLIFVFFLFVLSFVVISNVVNSIIVYECSFFVLSTITLFFLFWDIHFVEIIQIITKPLPDILFRIILIVLPVTTGYLLYAVRFDKGNRYFRIISSVILLSICAYAMNLFLQNMDQTSILNKVLFAGYIVYYLFLLVKHLSKQMEVSETIILIMTISIIVISFSLSNAFKVAYISKEALNLFGLVAGIVFTLIVGLCLLVENKTIRNAKDQTTFELFIDDLSVRFQGKILPVANILLISFIAISMISEYVFFPLLLQLFVTIFGSQIKKSLNNGNFFRRKSTRKT